jgi:hypothetical protein
MIRAMFATVALLMLFAGRAHAADCANIFLGTSGQLCQPQYTDNNQSWRDYGGLGSNSDSADLYATCGMANFVNPPAGGQVFLSIGNTGATTPFWCQMIGFTVTGSGWWGSPKYLCSTVGGCTSYTVAGANQSNVLQWTHPLGTTALSGLVNVVYDCLVPPGGDEAMIMEYAATDCAFSP